MKKYLPFLPAALFLGLGIWLFFNNAHFRADAKALRQENVQLRSANDSLHGLNKRLTAVNDSLDCKISTGIANFDSLKTKLEELNNRNIVTVHENYTTVTNLDLDGDIRFLSRYLSQKDNPQR